MDKKYRAVVFKMPNNSDKAERRYVIKDMESGEMSMMRRDMATNLHRRHMPDGRIKEGTSPSESNYR